jgi:hypothetical protein
MNETSSPSALSYQVSWLVSIVVLAIQITRVAIVYHRTQKACDWTVAHEIVIAILQKSLGVELEAARRLLSYSCYKSIQG